MNGINSAGKAENFSFRKGHLANLEVVLLPILDSGSDLS
jgi:hypothetical protein